MRKLASIQRVLEVRAIPGADNIEVVIVLGWPVVVQKGVFSLGQLVVFFEIDSWCDSSIPAFQSEAFQQRYTNWGTKRGMRLKTIKLRKQVSQGLVLRVEEFPVLLAMGPLAEGTDVTEILKIEKWLSPEEEKSNGSSGGGGKFPHFIRKTDQERVQNLVNDLEKYKDDTFEATIKLDGSSMTIYRVDMHSPYYAELDAAYERKLLKKMGAFGLLWYGLKKLLRIQKKPDSFAGVCSRNVALGIDEDNHFSTFTREHKLLEALDSFGCNIAVQGELVAPTIQGNYEQVDTYKFFVYAVFDIDEQAYLLPEAARNVAEALGLTYVPVLNKAYKLPTGSPREVVDAVLQYADGPGMNKGVKREGIVLKSNQRDYSFKAVSQSYLLKKEGKQ